MCVCVREYLEDALVPRQVAIIVWIASVTKPLLTGGTKPGGVSSLRFAVLTLAPFPLLVFCREVCEWEWPNSEGATTWQLPGVVAADQLCSQLEAKLLHCLRLR